MREAYIDPKDNKAKWRESGGSGEPPVRSSDLLGRIFRYAFAVFLAWLGYMFVEAGDWMMSLLMFAFSIAMWWRAGRPNNQADR